MPIVKKVPHKKKNVARRLPREEKVAKQPPLGRLVPILAPTCGRPYY